MIAVDLRTGKIVDSMRHGDVAVLYGDSYDIWHDYLWPEDEED